MLSALHYEVRNLASLPYITMVDIFVNCRDFRLDASEFKPRKDQRKALNRWNKYILGPEYMRKAARLCPKTREYAPTCIPRLEYKLRAIKQREEVQEKQLRLAHSHPRDRI